MSHLVGMQMEMHDSENALLDAFVGAVRALDPDILVGFEVQQGSLGFLADRASTLERPEPLLRQLSRTPQARPPSAQKRPPSIQQSTLSAPATLSAL